MSVALCLRLDRTATQAVERIWQELAASGVSTDMLELGYPPHLTLVVTNDDAQAETLEFELKRIASEAAAGITLGEPRTFPQSEVVYLSCEGDLAPLFHLQRLVAACMPDNLLHEHYRSTTWTPHVTLQTTGDAKRAMALASDLWRGPLPATFAQIDVVRFPPVQILASVALATEG